jgi:PsbP
MCRPNSQRPGVYISDFQTADKATVEELKILDGESIIDLAISAAVAPGANMSTDRLSLPPANAVKVEEVELDGKKYTYLQFPSETLTNSGYNIKRRNFAVAATRGDQLYTLCASARSDQYNEAKAEILATIVQSFRVRK